MSENQDNSVENQEIDLDFSEFKELPYDYQPTTENGWKIKRGFRPLETRGYSDPSEIGLGKNGCLPLFLGLMLVPISAFGLFGFGIYFIIS